MKKIYRNVPAALLLGVIFNVSAFAVGLGDIDVKKAFNRKFLAVIPVFLEESEGPFSAQVGTQADYDMMQVKRPEFIDVIEISLRDDPTRPGHKQIVLTTAQPIVQPSFNLIIRASAGGGSILENYFLAVDFRKSLTLDLPKEEKIEEERVGSKKPKPRTSRPTEPPSQPKPIETAKAEPEPPQSVKPVTPVKKAEPQPKRAAESKDKPAPQVRKEARQKPAVKSAPKAKKADRSARRGTRRGTGRGTGRLGDQIIKLDTDPTMNRILVKRGNTLYGLARKLGVGNKNLARIVAALYLENQPSFIGGNIHLLKSGATLSYNHINTIAAGISDKEARELIQRDWKDRRSPIEGVRLTVELPSARRAVSAQEILDTLDGWKRSWMEKDFQTFASFYSEEFISQKGLGKSAWVKYRKRWSKDKLNIKIIAEKINIARGGDTITLYFTQLFLSDRYSSAGLKLLTLRPTEGTLRIVEERFSPRRAVAGKNRWVIHIATYRDKVVSLSHIKRLQGAGFPAFEANSYLKDGKTLFRVVIGRFASRSIARQAEMRLREWGEIYSRVLKMPFAIKVATFDNSAEAMDTFTSLRKDGLSPYVIENISNGEKAKYGLYLGAFTSEDDAQGILDKVKKPGHNLRVEAP